MNNRQRRRRSAHKTKERPFPSEKVQEELYHGGTVYMVGHPFRYRSGRGIAKVGDPRGCNGPVKILVRNGVVAEGPHSAEFSSMAGVFERQKENPVETREQLW